MLLFLCIVSFGLIAFLCLAGWFRDKYFEENTRADKLQKELNVAYDALARCDKKYNSCVNENVDLLVQLTNLKQVAESKPKRKASKPRTSSVTDPCPPQKPATDKEIADAAREYVTRILLPTGNSTTEDLCRINDKLRKLVVG